MPRIALSRVVLAANRLLASKTPRVGWYLPGFFALKSLGLNETSEIEVYSSEIHDFLDRYFRLASESNLDESNGSTSKPYFNPFNGRQGGWTYENWSANVLNSFRVQTPLYKSGKLTCRQFATRLRWKLEPGYEGVLDKYVPKHRIPVTEFAVWMYRDRDFTERTTVKSLKQQLCGNFLRLTYLECLKLFGEDPRTGEGNASIVQDSEDESSFYTDDQWDASDLIALLP